MHEVKACQFLGGARKDLMLWTGTMLNVLSKKPCETPDSKLSMVEAFLCGKSVENWKEHARVSANELASRKNGDAEPMVVAGFNEQCFKNALIFFSKVSIQHALVAFKRITCNIS